MYIAMYCPICFILPAHLIPSAVSRALPNAGRSNAARMAMIATTMRSSIRVKIPLSLLEKRTPGHGKECEIPESGFSAFSFTPNMQLILSDLIQVKNFSSRFINNSFPSPFR